MKSEEIRVATCDDCEGYDPGGTGNEDAFRNLMLREIAYQLAKISELLQLFYEHRR